MVSAGFVLALVIVSPSWSMYPDSYRYAKQAEKVIGVPAQTAHLDALAAYCRTKADKIVAGGLARHELAESDAPRSRQGHYAACWDRSAAKGDVTTLDPRYQSIFTTRIGYPLLLAPFVATWGIVAGMRVFGVLMALLGSLAVYGVGRTLGLGGPAAVVGQLIYLVSPLGWWARQGLTEGLVNACVLGGMWGVLLLVDARLRDPRRWLGTIDRTVRTTTMAGGRADDGPGPDADEAAAEPATHQPPIAPTHRHRPVVGAVLLAACWIVLGITRYSTLLLVATALAGACAALAIGIPRARHRGTALGAGINALAAITVMVVSVIAALPGASVTLQDTFTGHFKVPDVSDPWQRLAQLNATFWRGWLTDQLHAPAFVLLTVLALVAMILWAAEAAWISAAVFAVGAASIAAHPLVTEAPRLGS